MWQCNNCKEQNEESFDICWKCGYGVDGENPNSIKSEVDSANHKIDEGLEAYKQEHQKQKRIKTKRFMKIFLKSISLLFILWLLIYIIIPIYKSYQKQEEKPSSDINATLINIYGKTDKRLKLKFISTYRPKSTASNPECKSYLDINTATKRVPLRAESRTIENQDEYNITIPVYNKDMRTKCEYEFVGISVRVERMYERGGLYASVPILSDKPYFIGQGTKYGFSSAYTPKHIKKYFRMPNGKKVSCFTGYYEKGDMFNENKTTFTCDLNFRGEIKGVGIVNEDSINIDININENRSRYSFRSRKLSIYNYKNGKLSQEEMELFDSKQKQFVMPERPLHIKIKNIFTGEDNE